MSTLTAQVSECPVANRKTTVKLNIGLNEHGMALLGAAVCFFGAVLWVYSGRACEQSHFAIAYVGARIVHVGEGARLYDLREQDAIKTSSLKAQNPMVYDHPPFEALLLSPLAVLPYRTAYLVWGLINILIWLSLPWILRPYAPAPGETLGYFALWFLFTPLGMTLYLGQVSLVLLLLYALTYINLKQERDFRAGLLLGLALFKFHLVLPFVAIFLLMRKWRFVEGFSVSAALLGALSLLVGGWRGILSYGRFLSVIARSPRNVTTGLAVKMATIQGFANSTLGRRLAPSTIGLIVTIASVIVLLFAVWSWRRVGDDRSKPSFDLMFAAAIVASLMVGFHVLPYDLSLLMLSILMVMKHFPNGERKGLRFVLGTAMVLLWIPATYIGLLGAQSVYLMFPLLLLFGSATLALAFKTGTEDLTTAPKERGTPENRWAVSA